MPFNPMAAPSSGSKVKRRTAKGPSTALDLQSFQALQDLARKNDLGNQEEVQGKPPRLSFLQRLGRGLSALEPANAFYQGKYEGKNYVTTYLKDVLQETGSAITGHELRTDKKKTFKDILVREGMKDREGKIDLVDVAGLAGDILTDPSTYFGGVIAKGIGKTVKGAAGVAEKVGMKVAPKITTATRVLFDAGKDALGRAFQYGYGASKFAKKPGVKFVGGVTKEEPLSLSQKVINSFENKPGEFKPGALERAKKELTEGIAPPIKVRTLDDGKLFLEDGRHRLEAARQLGLKEIPAEDVSHLYEPKVAGLDVLENEAKKYKNVDDFIKKYSVEESYDLTPGVTRLADTSETGLYHGAGVTNLKSILSDEKLKTSVSRLDDVGEKTLSASGNRSVANSYGVVFELDDAIPKRIAPKSAIKGDVYDAFEYRIDEDIPFSKIKNVTISLNKGEGLETKVLWSNKGKTPEYITAKELAKQFNEKGIKVIFNDGSNLTKSQLINTWNKAQATGETVLSKSVQPYVDEAVRIGDRDKFAKAVTKEELGGIDPGKFFDDVVEPKQFADEVSMLTNKVATAATKTGRKYAEMFKDLPKASQDDLVDGMIGLRKAFASQRETLMQGGKSFEDATKELVQKFDALEPEKLFKEKETIKFFSNTLLPELQAQKGKIVNATDIGEDMLMSYYFPFIKKNTMQELSRTLRVSKEGYLKRLKGTMDKADMLTDAPSAYAQRAFQVEKDIMTKDALYDWVGRFGKPTTAFKNADEAATQGYRLIKEKGMFGKDVGYLLENDHKFVSDLFDPSFKAIEDLAKATGFDAITSMFKKSVTGLFVPFHVRNFASGILQNYQVLGRAALRPDNIALGQKLAAKALSTKELGEEAIDIGKHLFKPEEIIQPFRDHFGISSQYISDFGVESLEKLVKTSQKAVKVGGQEIPLGLFETPRWVGNYIETQQKMTAYVTALRKGHDVPQALKLAEQAGFDYSKLAPFEKQVMRRIIPFYSFTRKNLELQLNTLAKNPQRLGTLLKFGRSAGTPQGITDGETTMPDWMRNRLTINFGKSAYGLPQVISGFGLPIEESADLAQDGLMGALSRLNPILKVPLESALGKDFFREQDIKDVYSAKEYSNVPKILQNFLEIKEVPQKIYKEGKDTGKTRIQYVADPERLHIARNLFTSRGFSYLDTLFGEEELSDAGRILKSLTGLKPYEIDETTIKYFDDRNNMRALTDLLKRYGVLKTFERSFIPAGDQPETPVRRILKKTKSGEVKRRELPKQP